jgi:hypothetical protein
MLLASELIELLRIRKLDVDDLTGLHLRGRRSRVVTTTRELHSESVSVTVINERLKCVENEVLCSSRLYALVLPVVLCACQQM